MTATTQTVWEQLGQALRGYFARRLARPDVVDDLVQTTFLRIHRGLDSLDDQSRLGPWVFRIARNVLTDHLRSKDTNGSRSEPITDVAAPEPADAPDQSAILTCLRSMLGRLPEDQRGALEAVELNGQTQAAYAASANLSLSGAKSRVQRGRAQLKRALLDCCVFQFDRFGRPVEMDSRGDCRRDCGCREG